MILMLRTKSRSSHWSCSVKKGVNKNFAKFKRKHPCQSLFFNKVAGLRPVDIGWPVLDKKIFLTVDCFSLFILPEILTGSFPQEFRWSGTRNKFRAGTLARIFNYSTEYHDLPSHYKYILLSLLRIKKNAIIFTGDKQRPQRNTTASKESM